MITLDKHTPYPANFSTLLPSSTLLSPLTLQLNGIAKAHLLRGEYEKMADLCRKCLPITQHVGDKVNIDREGKRLRGGEGKGNAFCCIYHS
jgi:hypothetical protein